MLCIAVHTVLVLVGLKMERKQSSGRRAPITCIQREKLVDALKSRPQLISGQFKGGNTTSRKESISEWQIIAKELNSVAGCVSKSWQQWKKTWQDLKSHNIKKRAALRKSANATGGGNPAPDVWQDLDEALSEVIPTAIVTGNEVVTKPVIAFEWDGDIEEAIATTSCEGNISNKDDHSYGICQKRVIKNTRPPTRVARLRQSQQITRELLTISQRNAEEALRLKRRRNELLEKQLDVQVETLQVLKRLADRREEKSAEILS